MVIPERGIGQNPVLAWLGKRRVSEWLTRVWLGIGSDRQQSGTTVPRALNDSLAVCLFPMSNTELGAVL